MESDSLPLQPIMEESFTIHLGVQTWNQIIFHSTPQYFVQQPIISNHTIMYNHVQPYNHVRVISFALGTQMKTSFNLRLLCCDVIDHLCAHRPLTVDGKLMPSPQRLQTAMGLYSNSLTGTCSFFEEDFAIPC